MLSINEKQTLVNYKTRYVPEFINARSKILWLKKQRNEAFLLNIKSISLQVKDIKQMRFSSSPTLISLYAKLSSRLSYLCDDDYITFSKNKSNKHIIIAIMNANWILSRNQMENMSIEEINNIDFELEKKILNLKDRSINSYVNVDYNNILSLLEYKKDCISNYLLSRIDSSKAKSKTIAF